MRKTLVILFLLFTVSVEAAPPARVATYTSGQLIRSADVTSNEDAIFNYLQAGTDAFADGSIVNADVNSAANIQSDKLNLTSIAQAVGITAAGSLTNAGATALNGTTNSIGDGGSDTLALNVPGGLSSSAMTWTLSGALTFSGTIADLGTVTTANIDGGTLDGVQIGGTTATGELIVNDSSDDADGLGSQGTSGQYLQSAGTGANPTWVTPLGVLLPTTSFSAAALTGNVSITSGKRYMGFLTVTSVSGALSITMQFDDDTAGVYSWANEAITFATSPTETITGDDTDTDINIFTTGSNDGVSCTFFIDATPMTLDGGALDDVAVHGTCMGWDGSNSTEFRGLYHDASTLSSFEFYASANAFTGTIKLYELN